MAFLGGLAGGAIGGAVVNLYLDDKNFKAGLAGAEAQTKKSSGVMGSSFSKLKAVGSIAFVAIAAAAVKFGVDAVAAAREHEEAVTQLTNAIEGDTSALQEQASALQMVTGFSDEAILSADTILARYELTTDQLQQLNPLILDYARATGQDAAAAAGSLGKALLGNTRALKAIGVDFEVTGNRAKDLQALMEALEDKVGGVSEAFAQTSAGRAEILNQQFDEIKETVGAGLLPILAALTDMLMSITPAIQAVSKGITFFLIGVSGAIYLIEDAIAGIATVLDHISGPLYDFDGTMSHLSSHTDEFSTALGYASGAVESNSSLVNNAAAVYLNYDQRVKLARLETTHFAKMTGDALGEWIKKTKDAFNTADDVWSNLADKAKVTAGDVVRAFVKQNRALDNYRENVQAVAKMGLEEDVIASLSEMGLEGARILEGLAKGSKTQIDKVNETFDTNRTKAGQVTGALLNVGETVKKLDGAKAHATVEVEYKVVGTVPPGVKP